MAKFTAALLASVVASSAAFVPQAAVPQQVTALQAKGFEEVGGVPFDPLGLAKLGTGESFDTFPNMFPNIQFLQEAEIKHGRQAMLAWTGVWATHKVRTNLTRGMFFCVHTQMWSSCCYSVDVVPSIRFLYQLFSNCLCFLLLHIKREDWDLV